MNSVQRVSGTLLLFLLSASSAAIAANVKTSISDVTIYTSGATVTRTATVNLSAGETEISFLGLPSNISGDNLQIEIDNRAVRMGQVSFKTQQAREVRDKEVLRLEKEISNVEQQLNVLADDSKVAKLQLKFLDSLATGYSKEAWVTASQANANIGSWQQALNLMQSGSSGAYEKIRGNQLKAAELDKDLDVLQRLLDETRQGSKSSKSVTVSLSANADASSQVKLNYYQRGATWYPIYEVRLDSDSGELDLSQKAVIRQATTENWDDVKVTLSTSQPTAAMAAPNVESVFLSLKPKYPEASLYADSASIEEVVVSAKGAPSRARSEGVELEGARSNEKWSGSYALNFPIAGRISVTNNNSDTDTYDLEKFSFPTKLVTQIVPRKSTKAFLGARFTNSGKLPLQGNKMTVFVDGVLIGSTQMPTILPGAEVTLPMGQDRRVEVVVADQGGEGGNSGVIAKQQTKVTDLIYQITNRRSADTLVEVKDAYPVSRDKAIKVVVDKKASKPDEIDYEEKRGVIVWRKTLKASENWEIRQNFKVTYPAKRSVSNRDY